MNGNSPSPVTSESAQPFPLLVDSVVAAKLLGMGTRKLWAMTNAGTIPHVRLGRNIRYSVPALNDWIAAQLQGGSKPAELSPSAG